MTRLERRRLDREIRQNMGLKMKSGPRYDRIENAKPDPISKSVMTWSNAYSATQEEGYIDFKIIQWKGSKGVTPKAPNWYSTVRTDTTDRLARAARTRKTLDNPGDV